MPRIGSLAWTRVEDGWLIEMYYRAAVSYQRSVFDVGENELKNFFPLQFSSARSRSSERRSGKVKTFLRLFKVYFSFLRPLNEIRIDRKLKSIDEKLLRVENMN